MALAWLDLHDSNLQLWHGDLHLRSPGYALLEAGQYRFGQTARAAARLRPRDVSTRYWWQLNTDTLQPALGPARHTADLVHAHLQALHRESGAPEELLLAASGSMRTEQVALLLGIIQQCPFTAVGLVNRSVALASLYAADGPLFHLEVQLHQALLSEIHHDGHEVALHKTTALPGCGLLALQERVVEAAASAFIRQTRFDPRRRAETEQQLYDALPDTLRSLRDSAETSLSLNGYHARLTRTDLQAASDSLYSAISGNVAQGAGARLLLDPLAGLLPGLQTRLEATVLQADDLQRALARHEPRLLQRAEALVFVSRLPAAASTATSTAAPTAPAEEPAAELAPPPSSSAPNDAASASLEPQAGLQQTPVATHLLRAAEAHPLQAAGTSLGGGWSLLGSDDGAWELHAAPGAQALLRNAASCSSGDITATGDHLQLADGSEALLIRVCS